tara:strand:- start:180 stop:311 length:132 start_codon:yes stop_codon:yes gene_type:complete
MTPTEKIKAELKKIKKQIEKIEEIIDLEDDKWDAVSYGGTDPD